MNFHLVNFVSFVFSCTFGGTSLKPEVKALMERLQLIPLPAEGTMFASTYRSTQEFDGGKPFGTAIVAMYCDDPPSISRFHRLPVDEVWHFYAGDPLRLSCSTPMAAPAM